MYDSIYTNEGLQTSESTEPFVWGIRITCLFATDTPLFNHASLAWSYMNANDVTTCIYVYACVRIIIYCVYVSSYTCTYNHKYVEVSSYVHHNDVIMCIYTSLIIHMTSDVYTRIRTQAPACIVYACDELRVYTWGYQLCVYTWGYEFGHTDYAQHRRLCWVLQCVAVCCSVL